MKFTPVLRLLIGLFIIGSASASAAPEWEDEAVFRINKEEPHATKMPFPDAKDAYTKERFESP